MPNDPEIKHDFAMVNHFLDLLIGSTNEVVTFQLFDDTKKNQKIAKVRHLKRNQINLYKLLEDQKKGCGVYVMVNEGDGEGRKTENVVKVRSLFVDLDGSPWEPATKMLRPHMRVESSLGRYHLYWRVSDCRLEQFKPIQQAIAKKFTGDKSCCDLPRVLRVPGFSHLKTNKPFLSRLVERNDFPAYTVQQAIDGLGLVLNEPAIETSSPQTPQTAAAASRSHEYIDSHGEVFNLITWAARNPLFDIIGSLKPQFLRGEAKDGKQHISCPFESEHTDPNPDLSTFASNARPPQYLSFDIHCMHAHCAGRDRLDFLAAMLTKGMLSIDNIQPPTPSQDRRPSKIYFPVDEISAALEWKMLKADEYRVALHIMTLAWATSDGTLPNDNWKLARGLGMPETEWQIYRDTLTRAGWLIEQDGRLTNSIVTREFSNAQRALKNAIARGHSGGKKRASQDALKGKSSVS